ncbi:MAG: hypothetical protein KF906_10940 [Actinobacteria bacterium]|nr:hypothetical protein [Actinomycetota bacterium]
MSPTAGIVLAGALLLLVAGMAKVARPAATQVALRTAGLPSSRPIVRLLGTAEVVTAAVTFVVAGTLGTALVALFYVGFASFSALLLRRSRGRASCGCFGGDDAPVTKVHVWLNLAIAAAALIALADPPPSIGEALRETPAAGLPFVALVLVLAWLLLVAFTVLPATQAAARPAPAGTDAAGGATGGQGLAITPKPGASA